MICPNCQMQQPQNNLAYCVRCNYPLQSRPQGFFTKSSQTGYSRADAYSAARRGQPGYPQQVPYPAAPPQPQPQQMRQPTAAPPNTGNIQIMYDANGNPVYVQMMYDRTGKPVYVQMIPKITGQDAAGNPIYTMIPTAQVIVPQSQPVPQPPQRPQTQPAYPQQQKNKSFVSGYCLSDFFQRKCTVYSEK